MVTLERDEQGNIKRVSICTKDNIMTYACEMMTERWKASTFSNSISSSHADHDHHLDTLVINAPELCQDWTDKLMDLFQFFAKHNLIWKRMEFDNLEYRNDDDDQKFSRSLVQAVNSLQLCHELTLSVNLVCINMMMRPPSHMDDADFLLAALSQNKRLRVLKLDLMSSCYTQGDVKELCQLLEETENLEEFSTGPMRPDHFESFLDSLSRNTSVRKLSLWPCANLLFQSFIDKVCCPHPKLTSLSLCCDTLKEEELKALTRLLRNSHLLTCLSIDAWMSGTRQTALSLLDSLSKNKTIRDVRLSQIDSITFSEIMGVVLQKDSLRSFRLDRFVQIIDDTDVKAIIGFQRRQTPLNLKLDDLTYKKNYYSNAMEQILSAHPGIRIQKPFAASSWPKQTFLRDFNWHGRYLLERTDVPLSLWPHVLQVAGKSEEPSNNNNIILYELLKGPSLCQRSPSSNTGLMDKEQR